MIWNHTYVRQVYLLYVLVLYVKSRMSVVSFVCRCVEELGALWFCLVVVRFGFLQLNRLSDSDAASLSLPGALRPMARVRLIIII